MRPPAGRAALTAAQNGRVNRDDVLGWVRGYELGWRAGQPSAVESLFTEDARYLRSPYEEPLQGHQAIKDFWLADEGETFTMTSDLVAVDGDSAVVRVEVRYGEPVRQEYRDLWLLRFDDDGRVREFEEWAYWPGKPYTVDGD